MVRMGRSVTLVTLVFALVLLGWAEDDLPSWQDVQAEEFCLRVPEGWHGSTAIAREDLLEDEEGLTLIGCWSSGPFPDAGIEEATALLVLLVEEEAWREGVQTLEDEATLRDHWEGLVAGEPGSWSLYDLVDPDRTFWVVYQDPPRSDGLHLVLMVGGPRPASVSDSVIRSMMESVRLCPSISHAPCTITVKPGESIQAAIDAAPEGAVICLAAGEWREHLLIMKSLTLRGEGDKPSTILGHRSSVPVIRVHAAEGESVSALLINLTVAEAGGHPGRGWDGSGISIEGSAEVTVLHCTTIGNWVGIAVTDNAQALLDACASSENFIGISVTGNAAVTIHRTTVWDNGWCGISATDTARAMIDQCTVYRNGTGGKGVSLQGQAQATVQGCIIYGNGSGIELRGSSSVIIERNAIVANTEFGLTLAEEPCSKTDTVFTGCVTGKGNMIIANELHDVCPDDLTFLMTDEGGELDRRE